MYRVFCPSLIAALLFVSPLVSAAQDGSGTTTKRPSPEEWSAQQRASATPLSDDDAALAAANSKALGEACGLTAAELSRLTPDGDRKGPAFEAAVEGTCRVQGAVPASSGARRNSSRTASSCASAWVTGTDRCRQTT